MTKYLAGVLSVIAVGVLLIAYGLLSPRTTPYDMRVGSYPVPGAIPAADRLALEGQYPLGYGYPGYAYPVAQNASQSFGPVQPRPVLTSQSVRRQPATRVERQPRRDWKKTALMIGGSTAAGAGLGGVFGGSKGALIGAAIGGGASTIYEAAKR